MLSEPTSTEERRKVLDQAEDLSMKHVTLLPHPGRASSETRVAMGTSVPQNRRAFFAGTEPCDGVA